MPSAFSMSGNPVGFNKIRMILGNLVANLQLELEVRECRGLLVDDKEVTDPVLVKANSLIPSARFQ